MKPGWKTTEFWVTLITQVLGILQLLGVIKTEEAVGMQQGAGQIVGGLMTVLPAIGYAISRGRAKQKQSGAGVTAGLVIALLLPAFLLMGPPPAAAATSDVTLAWDYDNAANPGVVGFKIYRIIQTAQPTDAQIRAVVPFVLNDKTARAYVDTKVPNGHVWYIATAFDNAGVESDSSNMANQPLAAKDPPPGTLRIVTTTTTTTKTVTTITTEGAQ